MILILMFIINNVLSFQIRKEHCFLQFGLKFGVQIAFLGLK